MPNADSTLRPGICAKVDILLDRRNDVLTLPITTIIREDGTSYCCSVESGRHRFYGEDKGTNYAQARYLCYYLQEQDKPTKFCRDFVANQKVDLTGCKTLGKILGEDDMEAF